MKLLYTDYYMHEVICALSLFHWYLVSLEHLLMPGMIKNFKVKVRQCVDVGHKLVLDWKWSVQSSTIDVTLYCSSNVLLDHDLYVHFSFSKIWNWNFLKNIIYLYWITWENLLKSNYLLIFGRFLKLKCFFFFYYDFFYTGKIFFALLFLKIYLVI